jgi:tellurite methyltransferase
MSANSTNILRDEFGDIDIYVFDQLLKGRIHSDQKILDAGCGAGRNIEYMLRQGMEVYGVDQNERAVEKVHMLAKRVAPSYFSDRFLTASVEELPFADEYFDVVLSIAVLHFAADSLHFERMMSEMARVLKPGGLFIARLASSVGIEHLVVRKHDEVYDLPDGSSRYLVSDEKLVELTNRFPGELIDPIKTTVVQRLRSMTTWCVRKRI